MIVDIRYCNSFTKRVWLIRYWSIQYITTIGTRSQCIHAITTLILHIYDRFESCYFTGGQRFYRITVRYYWQIWHWWEVVKCCEILFRLGGYIWIHKALYLRYLGIIMNKQHFTTKGHVSNILLKMKSSIRLDFMVRFCCGNMFLKYVTNCDPLRAIPLSTSLIFNKLSTVRQG